MLDHTLACPCFHGDAWYHVGPRLATTDADGQFTLPGLMRATPGASRDWAEERTVAAAACVPVRVEDGILFDREPRPPAASLRFRSPVMALERVRYRLEASRSSRAGRR